MNYCRDCHTSVPPSFVTPLLCDKCIIRRLEAETTQLKERIAELEAENELCEKVHLMVHNENQTNLNRIAELEAESISLKLELEKTYERGVMYGRGTPDLLHMPKEKKQ